MSSGQMSACMHAHMPLPWWLGSAVIGAASRYRAKLKQREKSSQQQMAKLASRMQELELEHNALAARQRAMTDLIDHQEFHINVLVNVQVCPRMTSWQLSVRCRLRMHVLVHLQLIQSLTATRHRAPDHEMQQ